MLNGALWLGAAVYYTLSVNPALTSRAVFDLLGEKYFAYLSGAITQMVLARYFYWHLACALVAWVHLVAEWLYLGRALHRFWLTLLSAALALGLLGSFWLGPKLALLHSTQHRLDVETEIRERAAKSFRLWQGVFQAVNVVLIAGVAVYFWRVTHPPDALRFVSPTKFRS